MTAPVDVSELAARMAEGRSPAEVAALTAMVRAKAARLRAQKLFRTPLDLACALDPTTVRTPALELVAQRVAEAITKPRSRLIISLPPQSGKSFLASVHGVLWALLQNPERRIVAASYGLELARTNSRRVRNLIEQHGTGAVDAASGQPMPDKLGLQLAKDHAAAADWTILGHRGGVHACGATGALTGFPADLGLLDDLHKDREEADSPLMREKIWDWYTNVLRTRLSPEASLIVIGTRWHQEDVTGRLLSEQPDQWTSLNIPAQSDAGVPDALCRPPGVWLESARGTTPEDWEATRRDVGERVWWSLYQGVPSPPSGGIFQQVWFDGSRVDTAPKLEPIVIAVDPAETGRGDEAGILVGGRASNGHSYVLADLSGSLSSAQWARRVCLAVATWGASVVVQERTLGLNLAIDDAWSVLRRQAAALQDNDGVEAALGALVEGRDTVAADEAQLREVEPLTEAILSLPSVRPCRLHTVTPKQSKRVRAEGITSLFELGRAHFVGRLPKLEHEASTWQEGQRSPNRLDVLAHLLTYLDAGGRSRGGIAKPPAAMRIPTSSSASRSSSLSRSTASVGRSTSARSGSPWGLRRSW